MVMELVLDVRSKIVMMPMHPFIQIQRRSVMESIMIVMVFKMKISRDPVIQIVEKGLKYAPMVAGFNALHLNHPWKSAMGLIMIVMGNLMKIAIGEQGGQSGYFMSEENLITPRKQIGNGYMI
jgi:hypothetical protein